MKSVADDEPLEPFFAAVLKGFPAACATHGSNRFDFAIASRLVRVHCAGDAISPLLRPLRHHPIWEGPGNAPSLEIFAWEGPQGWLPPRPPWKISQQGRLGEITGLNSERFRLNYDPSGLLCMFDQQSRRAIFWMPRGESLPWWEVASPFRVLFHWWAPLIGGQVAHAAAVGQNGEGVLLVGRSGSGKSTAAMACLDAGMLYVGDDYVLLTRNSVPRAHSLYSSGKLHTRFLGDVMPHWKPHVSLQIGPERKSVFLLQNCPAYACCLRSNLVIRAVVIPQISARISSRLTKRHAGAGLLALGPSTLFQLPGARHGVMTYIGEWLRELPVFTLESGTDLPSIATELSRLLAPSESIFAA